MSSITRSKISRRLGAVGVRFTRGFTIVELLIATTGMVLVMGMVYKIYDETQAATIKTIRRQSAIDYSVQLMDRTTGIIKSAIEPENFDPAVRKALNTEFKSNGLTVPRYHDDVTTAGLYVATIRAKQSTEDGHFYELFETPVAGATGTAPVQESTIDLDLMTDDFTPTLSFRYATEAQAGKDVKYVDSLESGDWPVLIEITIEVVLDEAQTIHLQTAVIPGGMPKSEIVAPPPTPTPTPPPAPAPTEAESDPAAAPAPAGSAPAPAAAEVEPAPAPAAAPASPEAATDPQASIGRTLDGRTWARMGLIKGVAL